MNPSWRCNVCTHKVSGYKVMRIYNINVNLQNICTYNKTENISTNDVVSYCHVPLKCKGKGHKNDNLNDKYV